MYSEKHLEDLIFNNKDIIHEFGFPVLWENTERQFELPSGKKIDLVSYETYDREMVLTIIELKKDKAAEIALIQVYGYLHEFLQYVCKPPLIRIYISVVLVGFETHEMPICSFLNVPVEVYTYKYGIRGPKFTRETVMNSYFGQIEPGEGCTQINIPTIDDFINKVLE